MTESRGDDSEVLFRSISEKGKGVIRKCAGSDDLYQIRCIYVAPDWSEPWPLDFIREFYCYEGARCVIDSVAAKANRS
jgi:hypothetical protein